MVKRDLKWYALFAVMAFMFVTFCYTDLLLIIRHSFGIYDTLRLGKPISFYTYSTGRVLGNYFPLSGEVPYDYWVYIPIALWNLPTYIWECVTGNTLETSLLAIWWGKAMLILPIAGSCRMISAIVGDVAPDADDDTRRLSIFMFLSSAYLAIGTGMLNQIDIFTVFFILAGIRGMLENDKKRFYIFFALAVTYKMLGLFAAIPLILYREKRILYALRDMLIVMSLTIASKLIFYADKMQCPTGFDEKRFSEYLFSSYINVGEGVIYLFFAAYICLVIFAYVSRYEQRGIIYLPFVSYVIFFLLCDSQPYWIVLLSPYVPLLMAGRNGMIKPVILLDTAAGVMVFLMRMISDSVFFVPFMNTQYGVFGRITGFTGTEGRLDAVLQNMGFDIGYISGAARSIFFALMVCLVLLLRPADNGAKVSGGNDAYQGVLWVRVTAFACMAVLPIILTL